MADLEFKSWWRQEILSSPKYQDWLCGPPKLLFSDYWGLLLGVKWLMHEASHLLPFSSEVKNEYSLLPGLHNKYRDSFPLNYNFTVTETADKYVSYVVPK
jgi:hypothetical protein